MSPETFYKLLITKLEETPNVRTNKEIVEPVDLIHSNTRRTEHCSAQTRNSSRTEKTSYFTLWGQVRRKFFSAYKCCTKTNVLLFAATFQAWYLHVSIWFRKCSLGCTEAQPLFSTQCLSCQKSHTPPAQPGLPQCWTQGAENKCRKLQAADIQKGTTDSPLTAETIYSRNWP